MMEICLRSCLFLIRYIELFRVRVGGKIMIEIVKIVICCIEVMELKSTSITTAMR